MKYILVVVILIVSPLAFSSEKIHSCKKRRPFVYSSFQWAEIEKNEIGQLHFYSGNGIDSQLLEVTFFSQVYEVAPEVYKSKSSQYDLTVQVKNKILNYEIISSGQKTSGQKYKCIDSKI